MWLETCSRPSMCLKIYLGSRRLNSGFKVHRWRPGHRLTRSWHHDDRPEHQQQEHRSQQQQPSTVVPNSELCSASSSTASPIRTQRHTQILSVQHLFCDLRWFTGTKEKIQLKPFLTINFWPPGTVTPNLKPSCPLPVLSFDSTDRPQDGHNITEHAIIFNHWMLKPEFSAPNKPKWCQSVTRPCSAKPPASIKLAVQNTLAPECYWHISTNIQFTCINKTNFERYLTCNIVHKELTIQSSN